MKIERAIVVTRRTRLEDLVARFNTVAQAKFYIEHSGADFSDYELENTTYRRALDSVHTQLERHLKVQMIDRSFLTNFLFPNDAVVVTVGQDGLVANAAKYVGGRPIVAINPDPARFDGVLLPFGAHDFVPAVDAVANGRAHVRNVTMAEAKLQDGQRLLAFNDFFVGANSHVSARYSLRLGKHAEEQSSSGVLVSTGAGSTGWISSVVNQTLAVSHMLGSKPIAKTSLTMAWDTASLLFVVREPFVSRASGASLVAGTINAQTPLVIESHMPRGGVVFSDGVENDFLQFNSGAIATIGIAPEGARLVQKAESSRPDRGSLRPR
jgi:NAD kinase